MKLNKEQAVEALRKIDDLVYSDVGFEADLVTGFHNPSHTIKEKMFAELIISIYKITHPLLHDCCAKGDVKIRRQRT